MVTLPQVASMQPLIYRHDMIDQFMIGQFNGLLFTIRVNIVIVFDTLSIKK